MFVDRFFFSLLLIFLPTQLGKHFFPQFSLLYGGRIDYLAPTIYFTDILLFLMLLSWLFRIRKSVSSKFNKKIKTYLLCGLVFLLLNLFVSQNKEASAIKIVKLVELVLLFSYVYWEKISFVWTLRLLFAGAFYSLFIALFQYFKQASLGGPFWLLGERSFSLYTPGIAKAIIFGKVLLRPYATFPHPNVLAGFLVSLLPFLVYKFLLEKKKVFLGACLFLFILVIILTLSRVAIIVGFVGLILEVIILKRRKKKSKYVLLIFLSCLVLFGYLLIGRFQSLFIGIEDTFLQRQMLFQTAINIFKNYPLFGAGFNNYLVKLPASCYYCQTHSFFQPVHNTYLLIAVESGILGFLLVLLFLNQVLKRLFGNKNFWKLPFIICFAQIVVLLFFDHYFYTLQQSQLLLTVLFAFMIKKNAYA